MLSVIFILETLKLFYLIAMTEQCTIRLSGIVSALHLQLTVTPVTGH